MEIKHISHLNQDFSIKSFGFTPEGQNVEVCELVNKNGAKANIITYGATLTSLQLPIPKGILVDVVLGFDNLESYIKSFELDGAPYFGSTVGRYAGRIKDSKFTLNGKDYQLNTNNFNHSLHGGIQNFSRKNWTIKNTTTGENPSVTLTCESKSGEENYPGDLNVEITYTLTEADELVLEYKATTSEDTVINLTHHSYFNLDGHKGTVVNQQLQLPSATTVEITNEGVPTGKIIEVANTKFDFREVKACPDSIDNSFVIEDNDKVAATLTSVKNNLKMEVITDQPSVHIYVGGKTASELENKEGVEYHSQSGICFETQNYPDAPNHSHFPNSVLKAGEIYQQKTIYKFSRAMILWD
ncbi:aldose epimerase family protein [Flavobacterium sp. NG2]|uniref:aldose epimerase family protein n=1 Tax=Flavobacterium sp. NG2 TaxID=3097547 RepID=UPI002A82A61B|nr:aldose epimerase family protein [Flavobacterium sp. NG2]WPR71170.1 aldose epimerase family protein [Flavobacterium sp. NG2]